jgi:hypothetical protein
VLDLAGGGQREQADQPEDAGGERALAQLAARRCRRPRPTRLRRTPRRLARPGRLTLEGRRP